MDNSKLLKNVKKIENIGKKIIFAKDFGILGKGEDYTENIKQLQEYLDNNTVDEVLFEADGIIYTDINLKAKNCILNGQNTTIMPINNSSYLFGKQKAIIVLDDNSSCHGFIFNGNKENNYYEQDGKIFYSGASSTTHLVVSIGCTGVWIIGDNCSCYNNTFIDLQWTCVDINGKAKPTQRNKNIDVFSNTFFNSGEDHIAIHNTEDVRVYSNYSYNASNHAIHPYSFCRNIKIYDNYVEISIDGIFEWNEGYVDNSQRTAFILDHPQYPQSDVQNIIIQNNIVKGQFKAAVEITGYTESYCIFDNEFIGDGTNIGIRYKTISLGDNFIKRNRFKNLSKSISVNTLSMLSLPTYDTVVSGSVLIEQNTNVDVTTVYEIFAVADIEGIESFTFTCKNNNFYNVQKYGNIQTLLTNFHLRLYDEIDLNKTTLNGNTLYTRDNSVKLSEQEAINIFPYNFKLRDINNNILGLTTRAKFNTGIDTVLSSDEDGSLIVNTNGSDMKSYTYAQLCYNANPLTSHDTVSVRCRFSSENNVHFYLILQALNQDGSKLGQVTLIDKELIANEEYTTDNIFNLSKYKFNDPSAILNIIFQFGDSDNFGEVVNFKFKEISIADGIVYNVPIIHKEYTLSDITRYIEPLKLYASAPPTDGTYKVGTTIINTSPKSGSYIGWVYCSNGNWLGYGLIS